TTSIRSMLTPYPCFSPHLASRPISSLFPYTTLFRSGLMISRDGGRTWSRNLRAQLMGLALNPTDPKRILASGPGVSLSTNGGGKDRKSTRLNSSHDQISYAVFCLKKKKQRDRSGLLQ